MDSRNHGQAGRNIVDLLFRAAYEDRTQLELTALGFHGLCLARAGDLVREYVPLEGLQHLQLLRCNDVYPFLEAVTQKYSGLQTFVLKHCRGGSRISALNNFLRVATPRRLVVRLLHDDGPYFVGSGAVVFDTLSPYAHTIQGLVLDDSLPGHYASSYSRSIGSSTDFQDLCKSLQSLQQLCVASPRIAGEQSAFLRFLSYLKFLHNLRVLSLVYDPHYCRHTAQTYQEAADRIFETLIPGCPQLSAVVLEARLYMDPMTRSFIRSEQGSHQARAKYLGVDVAPHVIRAHGPCSDMLEPEKIVFG